MANENALKLAFHKRPGATRILALEHAFSGRTLALASITDKAAYRAGLPAVVAVDYLPFFDAEHPAESTERRMAVLRTHVARYPNQHAALWCEFVQGEGGFTREAGVLRRCAGRPKPRKSPWWRTRCRRSAGRRGPLRSSISASRAWWTL